MGEHWYTLDSLRDQHRRGVPMSQRDLDYLFKMIELKDMQINALRCSTCKTPLECGLTVAPLCRIPKTSIA